MAMKSSAELWANCLEESPSRQRAATRPRGVAMTIEDIRAWMFVGDIRLEIDRGILFDPKLKSPVKDSGLREWLSDRPGVYFVSMVEKNDFCNPVYIGMSGSSVSKRLSSGHQAISGIMSSPEYCSKLFCVHVVEPPLHLSVKTVESAAIARWSPALNKEKLFPSADEIELYVKEIKECVDSYSFF